MWLTFDCYGTLIDWEGGVRAALLPLLPPETDGRALAARYIAIEAEVEHGAYRPYREVLDRASRRLLAEHGRPLGDDEPSPLPASLPRWRPFPEVPAALRALRERGYRLAILSNVDRDLIAASIPQLGVEPDLVVTAEDCGSYKPAPGHWQRFAVLSAAGPADTIHVAASQYHDIVPATALGYRTVFVNRHREPIGAARPTRELPDLSGLPACLGELTAAD